MGEQVPKRDRFLARSGELGDVTLGRRIQVELSFRHRDHDAGGETDDLGERREVIQRLRIGA